MGGLKPNKADSIRFLNKRQMHGNKLRKLYGFRAATANRDKAAACFTELVQRLNKVDKGEISAEEFEAITGLCYADAVRCWYNYALSSLKFDVKAQVVLNFLSKSEGKAILDGEALP